MRRATRRSSRARAPSVLPVVPEIQTPGELTSAQKAMLGEQLMGSKRQQDEAMGVLQKLLKFRRKERGHDFGTDFKPAVELDHHKDMRDAMVELHAKHPRVKRIFGSARALHLADQNFQVSLMKKLDPEEWKQRGKRALLPGSPQMGYHGDGTHVEKPLMSGVTVFYACNESVGADCGGDLLISLQLSGDVRRRGKEDRKEHPHVSEVGKYLPRHATTYFFAGDITHAVMPVLQEGLSRYAIIQFYALPEWMVGEDGEQIKTSAFLERERGRNLRGWTLFCSQCSRGYSCRTSLLRHYREEHPQAPRGKGCEDVEFKGFQGMPFLHIAGGEDEL
jgi:hypothetical protein